MPNDIIIIKSHKIHCLLLLLIRRLAERNCSMSQFPSIVSPLTNISIYSTNNVLVLVGFDRYSRCFRILEIDRPAMAVTESVTMRQDPCEYDRTMMDAKLMHLSECNSNFEKVVDNVACIFGIIKLLESHHLIYVTKKRKVASINGHYVYSIAETQVLAITYKPRVNNDENKYKKLFLDLSKGFYFSLTYDLTNTMQNNFVKSSQQPASSSSSSFSSTSSSSTSSSLSSLKYKTARDLFVWNSFALKPFLTTISEANNQDLHLWTVPVLHGFVMQRSFTLSSGYHMKVCLIARR